MAVFTDITETRYSRQLSAIEIAFDITITNIVGLIPGTSDSKFTLTVDEFDEPLVLTLHETPNVSPMGKTSKESQTMLRYIDYLSGAISSAADISGEPVNAHVLKPLRANPQNNSEPFIELSFDGHKKAVSIVPFIRGKSFENSPEEVTDPYDTRLAGRALAGYLLTAQSYPQPHLFADYHFPTFIQEINRLSETGTVFKKLGMILSGQRLDNGEAERLGREYLMEMNQFGLSLLNLWDYFQDRDSDLIQTIVHGDLYTDNTMLDEQGRFYLLDFNEVCRGSIGIDIGIALNSWASENGVPRMDNVKVFLEGFDSVIPISGKALSQIPAFAQFGAFRWETFRIQRIEMQDPDRYTMRSPLEFQSLRLAWHELGTQFDKILSVQDLL